MCKMHGPHIWCKLFLTLAMSFTWIKLDIIIFSHFYLFRNGLTDLFTLNGLYCIKKCDAILHRMLNLGFQNFRSIFQNKHCLLVATFSLYLWLYIGIHIYVCLYMCVYMYMCLYMCVHKRWEMAFKTCLL